MATLNSVPPDSFPTGCLTQRVFYRFRRDLLELAMVSRDKIRPDARLDELIPATLRRNVWRELASRGYRLPGLELPFTVIGFNLVSAAARSALLAWLFNWPVVALMFFPFVFTSWLVSRPFAVRVPRCCETVREAVLQATPFRRVDYDAGLWPRSELSAKIRLLLAEIAGVPFDDVREDTSLVELFP
jgi:hypothetical protein